MVQISIAKHAVAFPSKVLARDGGKHIYNIQLAEAAEKFVDNGWFVGGEKLTHAFALDTNGDFTPDAEEAVFDGAFHESYFQSAPYFAIQIDGITWLNAAF